MLSQDNVSIKVYFSDPYKSLIWYEKSKYWSGYFVLHTARMIWEIVMHVMLKLVRTILEV